MSDVIIFNKIFHDNNIDTSAPARPSSMLVRADGLGARMLSFPSILPKKVEREVEVKVPENLQFRRINFLTLPQSSEGCVAEVLEQPTPGATGKIKVRIAYTLPAGGAIVVRLRVYAKAIPQVVADSDDGVEVLHLVNFQSVERLDGFMSARRHVALVLSGDDAIKLIGTGLFANGLWTVESGPLGPRIKVNPTWEWVAIAGMIAGAVVSALTMYFFIRMITSAIQHNYKIGVKQAALGDVTVGGASIDISLPTLVFDLQPV